MRVFLGSARPDPGALVVSDTSEWPFRRHVTPSASTTSTAIHIANLHLAFPAGQVTGTRLVLTQSTYQLQRWLVWQAAHPRVTVTADANGPALRRCAAEAFTRRGPWSRIEIVQAGDEADGDADNDGAVEASPLHQAFMQPDPGHRRDACARAVAADPMNPALLLALGSAHMELLSVGAALDVLEEAVSLAPDWAAAHFELGKAWLRADDTTRAADAFAQTARLMPTFATAWTNLGAALGELERRDEALVALHRALEHDPYGHPTLNNLGVVFRDLGRLADAEAVFRQVVALAPAFVFGWYNLAQTLLLAGDCRGAREMYEEAFERDPQKSARQAIRLAVARAATGDEGAALDALASGVERLTGEALTQALDEAERALTGLLGNVGECDGTVRRLLREVSIRSGRP